LVFVSAFPGAYCPFLFLAGVGSAAFGEGEAITNLARAGGSDNTVSLGGWTARRTIFVYRHLWLSY